MILGILKGGLGNQLFQYAATKSLAEYHHVPFHLDVSFYNKSKNRVFKLHELLSIDKNVIARMEIPRKSIFQRFLNRLKPWYKRFYIHEQEGKTKDLFYQFPKHCIIDGYWQQVGFFDSQVSELRQQLLTDEVRPVHQIAVHFRGGDYYGDSQISSFHGVLNEDYYKQAFETMHRQYPNAQFFLFSDNPEYFQYTFLANYPTLWVEEKNDVTIFKELCKFQNFIIANSSFSWWPAFLNDDRAANIIAPREWYQVEHLKNYSPVLSNWLLL